MFRILISYAGQETQSEGEETFDDLFTYKEGDEATYFVFEGLGDQELDVGPSGGAATTLERVRLSLRDMSLRKFWKLLKKDHSLSQLPRKQLLGRLLLKLPLLHIQYLLKLYRRTCLAARWIPL